MCLLCHYDMRINWLKKNWITGQKNWNIVKEKKGEAQFSGERIWMIAIYNTLIKYCYFVMSWSKTSLLRHKILMNACNFFNWFMICSHKQRKWNDVELTRNLIYWETIWLLALCLGIPIYSFRWHKAFFCDFNKTGLSLRLVR